MIGSHHLVSVVKQDGRLRETGAHRTAVEEHEVECRSITGGRRGKAVSCLSGVASLDAKASLVGRKQNIGITTIHVTPVNQWHTLLCRADDLGKDTVTHRITGQSKQIVCRTVIVRGRHTVWIGEVGAAHAEVNSLFVHHVAEFQRVASDMLC